jgi:hypothetical protein
LSSTKYFIKKYNTKNQSCSKLYDRQSGVTQDRKLGGGWVQNREFFLGKKETEARNDSGSSFMTIQLVQSG